MLSVALWRSCGLVAATAVSSMGRGGGMLFRMKSFRSFSFKVIFGSLNVDSYCSSGMSLTSWPPSGDVSSSEPTGPVLPESLPVNFTFQ